MNCKNCGHEIEEVEAPDFQGDVVVILVHKEQSKYKLVCEERCFCKCVSPQPKEMMNK